MGREPGDAGLCGVRGWFNGGGVYGSGVQDGFVVGPEVGLGLDLLENVAMRAYVAYDYQFRQPDWDDGILWGGLNFGVRF